MPIKIWKEPKRRGGPTMNVKAVRAELGYSTTESILVLMRKGPENDGLPGYIPAPDGFGWIRKIVPNAQERAAMEAAGQPYETRSGAEIMFYSEDVAAWKDAHPVRFRDKEHIPYTEEQQQIVLDEAKKLQNEDGQVIRSKLLARLREIDATWNDRKYGIMRQILNDAGISRPKSHDRNTAETRRMSPPRGARQVG